MRISLLWMNGLLLLTLISSVVVQAETTDTAGTGAADGSIQLAAAIGIVKPGASPAEPAASSVEPPPVVESTAPASSAVPQAEETSANDTGKSGPSTKTILIGAGVAALLGVAAGGGGGGGGGSSTPQH